MKTAFLASAIVLAATPALPTMLPVFRSMRPGRSRLPNKDQWGRRPVSRVLCTP